MLKYTVIFLIVCALLFSCGMLLQDPPGSTITISAVSAVPENTSVTIVWTTDIPSTHLVRYDTTSGSYTNSTTETTTPTVLHSVVISGLASNTTYYFVVQNNAPGAVTATNAESSFATADTITISNLTATSITLTSATISWDTNVATTHLVEYGTAPGTYLYSTMESIGPGLTHSVPLSGLTPSTTYYYRVKNFHTSLPNLSSVGSPFATLTETLPTMAQKLRGIWIIGGLSGATLSPVNTVGQVDLYDPDTNSWFPITSLPTPVSFAAAVSCGGKIYVMGGFNGSGIVQSLNQIYTVSSDSWSSGAVIGGGTPAPRANLSAVTMYNKIYLIGGTTANAVIPYAGSNAIYEYDTIANSWSLKTTVITVAARSEILELADNDVIYHLGGRSTALVAQTTHDGYAVSAVPPNGALTTGVTEAPLLTAARTGHCGVLYKPSNNPAMMALVGGFSALGGTGGCYVFNNVTSSTQILTANNFQYLYYPFAALAAWRDAPIGSAYPINCGFSAAALYGSTLYVFGGTNSYNSVPVASVYSFNLDNLYSGSGLWTLRANMPISGRFGHNAVRVNP